MRPSRGAGGGVAERRSIYTNYVPSLNFRTIRFVY